MALHGLQNFASGVLTQINGLLGLTAEGFVCAKQNTLGKDIEADELRIIAITPQYSNLLNQSLVEVTDTNTLDIVTRSLNEHQSFFEPNITALYFNNVAKKDFTLFLDTGLHLNEMDKRLLDVFAVMSRLD